MAELTKLTGTYIRSGSIPTTALSGGVVSSSLQVVSALPGNTVSSSAQVTALLPTDTVSSSAQVKSFLPNGTVSASSQYPGWVTASSQIDYGQLQNIPSGIASSSAQVTAYLPVDTVSSSVQVDITNTTNYTTFSSSLATVDTTQTSRLAALENVTGSYATTGSNIFVGTQSFSNTTNTTNYLDGAIHVAGGMSIRQDLRVSGSVTINGLLTAVSMSTQYVTASQYNVGVSKITLNDDDTVRFAGISIYDSGSSSPISASIYWDSLQHRFIYENLSGSSYNSSIIIAGPKHTGSLGDEPTLTSGYIPVATGGDHIDNSVMFQSASNIGIGTTNPSSKLEVSNSNITISSLGSSTNSTFKGVSINTADLGGSTGNAGVYLSAPYGGGTTNQAFFRVKRGASDTYNGSEIAFSNRFRFLGSTTEDTNERLRIDEYGNIGIGTTSVTSGYKLDVRGLIYSYVASGNTSFVAQTGTNANAALNAVEGFGLELNTDATNRNLRFSSNNTVLMTILGGGNVGIGATNPTQKLHISGSSTVVSLLESSGTYAISRLKNSTLQADIGVDTTGLYMDTVGGTYPIVFYINGSERMRISGSGNVGIGTTDLGAKLHLLDTTQNLINVEIHSSGLSSQNWINLDRALAGKTTISEGALTGRIAFRGYDGTNYITAALISSATDAAVGTNDMPGRLMFSTTADGASSVTERMRITSAGNIGIGTTSPNLSAGSAGSTYLTLSTSTSGRNSVLELNGARTDNGGYTGYIRFFNNLAASPLADIQAIRAGADTTGSLAFATTNVERMRIDSSGNVGIGTTGPKNKLHVNGSVQVGYVDTLNDALVLSWNGASSYGSIQTFSSSHLALNPSGNNVGIGTTNPSARLNIAHPNHGVAIDAISSYYGSVGGIFSSAASSTYPFNVYGNIIIATRPDFGGFYDIVFTTAASNNTPVERMVVKSSGNVGIGITNPDSKLVITESQGYGSYASIQTAANSNVFLKLRSSQEGGARMDFANNITSLTSIQALAADVSAGSYNDGLMTFWTAKDATLSERMRITYDGNVGIGTTSPTHQLHLTSFARVLGITFNETGGTISGFMGYEKTWVGNSSNDLVISSETGNNIKFYTNGSATLRMTLNTSGHLLPGANGTQDLGSSSLRWSTVYTSDLSLSNGIGDWTIVEGEDDLFIYNNKNNKVYKFTLQEVDPSTATPKKS